MFRFINKFIYIYFQIQPKQQINITNINNRAKNNYLKLRHVFFTIYLFRVTILWNIYIYTKQGGKMKIIQFSLYLLFIDKIFFVIQIYKQALQKHNNPDSCIQLSRQSITVACSISITTTLLIEFSYTTPFNIIFLLK